MNPDTTAMILVGFQNDYFAQDGVLRGVVEDSASVDSVLANTVAFITAMADSGVTMIATPIVLTADYRAMANPVGILNTMKEAGAFTEGSVGAKTIPEILAFGDRIQYVTGKVGFNAFANTALADVLQDKGITDVLVAGQVTSLCIDSTGRAAYERGYDVTILADCTSSRTTTEHDFFCDVVFPLYGRAKTTADVLNELMESAT
ncbi:MAG: cysteine hydrolase family protein [Acidimicrobiales bacterium]